MSRELLAGVARANITPPVGIDMVGGGLSMGIHDDLLAKALVLSDGATSLAVISADLLNFDMNIVNDVRGMIEERAGIPRRNVLIAASHNHASPVTHVHDRRGKRDETYVKVLEKKLAGAVYEASRNLRQANLGIGKGHVQIGMNRREKTPEGRVVIGRNPAGPIDKDVDVLRINTVDGENLAVLFCHACHPLGISEGHGLISAGFPAYATFLVENVLGGTAMYLQGCSGNINPLRRETFKDAKQAGNILGAEVVKAAEQVEVISETRLAVETETVSLPLKTIPSLEEAVRIFQDCDRRVKEKGLGDKIAVGLLEWSKELLTFVKGGSGDLIKKAELQVIAFSNIGLLAAIPGEVFTEIGMTIKERCSPKYVIAVGCANGCVGYIPTAEACLEGGYEVDSSYIFFYGGLSPLAPDSERIIADAVVRLCEKISYVPE